MSGYGEDEGRYEEPEEKNEPMAMVAKMFGTLQPLPNTSRAITIDDEPFIRSEMMKMRPLFVIANQLGVSRRTLYRYIHKFMSEDLEEMKEMQKDFAEGMLMENIASGNQNSIEYYLDRQAKDRGYGEKMEVPASALPVINIGRIEIKNEPPQRVIDVG